MAENLKPRQNLIPERNILSPVTHETGAFRLVSKDIEDLALEELHLTQPSHRENAAGRIAFALAEFRIQVVNERFHISDSSEIKRARQTAKNLRATVDSLNWIGRDAQIDALGAVFLDWEPDETKEGLIEKLEDLAEALEWFVKNTKPTKGRQPLSVLDDFIAVLFFVYWEVTGAMPRFSSQPESKPGSTGKLVHGPFVRFCTTLVCLVNPAARPAVFESVRRVSRGLSKNPERWNIILMAR
jgi:hypothetical protein